MVENDDYIDLNSRYDGKSVDYNQSLWYMNKLEDVPIPDPYVYVENDVYYIVGTSDRNPDVVDCYVTTDFVDYQLYAEIYNPVLYDGWEDREEALVFAPEIYCFDGVYYMYGTRCDREKGHVSDAVDVYTSADLENWSAPAECCKMPEAYSQLFAPEVHAYNGAYYMLVSPRCEGRRRGT